LLFTQSQFGEPQYSRCFVVLFELVVDPRPCVSKTRVTAFGESTRTADALLGMGAT
jgi:hypothetical protein